MSHKFDDVIVIEDDDDDIEEQLQAFTINKIEQNSAIGSSTNTLQRIEYEQNIPILISDIQQIQRSSNNFNDLSTVHGVKFKTLTIYGIAIPIKMKLRNNSILKIYRIDDGTGSVIVHYSQKLQNQIDLITEIDKLEHEINAMRKSCNKSKNKEYEEVIYSMQIILNKIKNQSSSKLDRNIDATFLHDIFNVSVIGIPFMYGKEKNEIRICGLELNEDREISRDKEIFFKNYLIDYYEKKFLKEKIYF